MSAPSPQRGAGSSSTIHVVLHVPHSRDFFECDLVGFVFLELARSAEHVADGAGGKRVLTLHDELVIVGGAQLDVGGVRALTAAVLRVLVLADTGRGNTQGLFLA